MKGFDTPETNPFLDRQYQGRWMGAVSAEDRKERVARMTPEQLRQARQVPGLQLSVLKAIDARLRRLDREARAANPYGFTLRDLTRRA
ncbi:hypothetical protein [Sediminicurvatus halobius]|uniref:Uncharacterized protein n=1 Tax=Sediminicurvatus halobius TaxID=2182432 RepID=A0A2U2N1H3_9GAMM|nr:hypothetical protein [Spiribacter halobius]PWG62829.1 hypothetical protein DEM34_10710 [Spiribacter halobius]UEX77021.1 hypothetical protein LMH63_13845 [Spiribacter halobius]